MPGTGVGPCRGKSMREMDLSAGANLVPAGRESAVNRGCRPHCPAAEPLPASRLDASYERTNITCAMARFCECVSVKSDPVAPIRAKCAAATP